PATVIHADLWKLGQLKAGDKIRFIPVSIETANAIAALQETTLNTLTPMENHFTSLSIEQLLADSAVLHRLPAKGQREQVVYRASGDRYLLIEYGPLKLDIRLRFRVHALMLWLEKHSLDGILELTP